MYCTLRVQEFTTDSALILDCVRPGAAYLGAMFRLGFP